MILHDPKPPFVELAIPSLDSNQYAEFCPRLVSDGTSDKPAVWYESANKKLWDILFSTFNDHPSYAHIQSSRRTKDGYGAYNALRQHYLGEDAVKNMAAEMEAEWNRLTYTGKGRQWNFEKYVTKHVELYAHAQDLKQFGYAGIDASSCVRRFMAGIKTNKLDHTRGSVNGNRHLKKDFEKVVKSTRTLSPKTISRMLESSSQVRLRLSKVTVMVAASDARPSVPMDRSHRLLSPTVIVLRWLSMPNSLRTRRRHFTSFNAVANDSVGMRECQDGCS
jgi:hypothetical protein